MQLPIQTLEIRIASEDGQPEEDFPPLGRSQTLKRLSFTSLCLCKANAPKTDLEDISSQFIRKVFGVSHYAGGSTLIQLKEGMTINDVLRNALQRRGYRGLRQEEYVLYDQNGTVMDGAKAVLDIFIEAGHVCHFHLNKRDGKLLVLAVSVMCYASFHANFATASLMHNLV
eukprot:m.24058 g.24058  ORF g.24058 m.24058 type:complete len:171 (-) comp8557_c0_seq4:125-637(-)